MTSFLAGPNLREVDRILDVAFTEDAPYGDVTSEYFVPQDAQATAVLAARVPGILSGISVFERAFTTLDPGIEVTRHFADGEQFSAGDVLARVQGPARAVLQAERIGLNLVQRMSAIATMTRSYVDAAGPGVRIADTRKTTPGLRALERYAVRCGGGHNHRQGLSDAVMLKDNHLAVLTGGDPARLSEVLKEGKARLGHTVHLEVEVDSLAMIEPVLAAGVDTIMLDNFTLEDTVTGVAMVNGRAVVEASGNVTLERIAELAATGVDVISSGALTHSVRALDLGLDIGIDALS